MVIETRLFHDSWWGKGEPIHVSAVPWTKEHNIGHIRRVRFINIMCRGENGVFVQGHKKGLIEDILFENVRVEIDKWTKIPGGKHDIRPCDGEGVYEHPTSGFFIKNASNVVLRNCEVIWGENPQSYFRHAVETHGTDNLKLENFRGRSAAPKKYKAILKHR